MLVAKINPPAKRVMQVGPFSTQEFTGDCMIARCDRLAIGTSDKIEFTIRFGNITYQKNIDGSDGRAMFDKVYQTRVEFTAAELATWGTDDSVVYDIIAQKMGFTVLSKFEVELTFTN